MNIHSEAEASIVRVYNLASAAAHDIRNVVRIKETSASPALPAIRTLHIISQKLVMRTSFDGVEAIRPHTPVSAAAVVERRDKTFGDMRQGAMNVVLHCKIYSGSCYS